MNGKTLDTIKARAALAGHAVYELADGGFLIVCTKWASQARHCPDAAALAAFLAVLEGLQ